MRRAFLLLVALVSMSVAPVVAQTVSPLTAPLPEVRAGEIGLEGEVVELNGAQVTLSAVAFSNPGGKRALLKTPKTRVLKFDAPPDFRVGDTLFVVRQNAATLQVRAYARLKAAASVPAANAKTETPPAKPAETPARSMEELLPPEFEAVDLKIKPVWAGFDYAARILPGVQTFDRTPVFCWVFQIDSPNLADAVRRIRVGRIFGPQNQFVRPHPRSYYAIKMKDAPNRVGFYNAGVDPNWEYIDMDVDIFAPADQKGNVQHVRLRLPIRELRKIHAIAPGIEAPRFLGSAQNDEVQVVVDSDGGGWSNGVSEVQFWTRSAQQAAPWRVASAKAHLGNGLPDVPFWDAVQSNQTFEFHSDGSPKLPGEGVQEFIAALPPDTQRYDLQLDLESRARLEADFSRTITLPLVAPLAATNEDNSDLVLRKAQLFSRPEDLANYPQQFRDYWPQSGIALVFEVDPTLGDAEVEAQVMEAEDDASVPILTGTFGGHHLMVNTDITDRSRDNKGFYSLVIEQPAPGAKSITIWFHTVEKARAMRKSSLEIKGIVVPPKK